jgi:adenine C2-methylase RlmN of 23S rRNA A2503 and tRNA A37
MATDKADAASDKLTLRLSPDARQALEWMANKRGVTLGEVIRRAIGTEKFLIEETDRGGTVLIEEKSGRVKQLVLI